MGDGSTTFNLPDLRGRVAAGKDNMGGVAAGLLTLDIVETTLGAGGGVQTTSRIDGPNDVQGVDVSTQTGNVASQNHKHANIGTLRPTMIINCVIRIRGEARAYAIPVAVGSWARTKGAVPCHDNPISTL